MSTLIYVLLFVIVVFLIVLLILQFSNRNNSKDSDENEKLKETLRELEVENTRLNTQVEVQKAQIEAKDQQIYHLQEQVGQLLKEQSAEKERQIEAERTAREKEGRILEKIAPVSETVTKMQKKIEELEGERKEQYGSIRELMHRNTGETEKLTKVTGVLSSALKSNQSRGQWGEAQLRNIVEATGMVDHVEFETQASYTSDDGTRYRPDMVISLPGDKKIVIDAKAPMDKYMEGSAITIADGEDAQNKKEFLLKEHAKAVKLQVDNLSKKEYWTIKDLESVDFTILFIPSEASLSAALQSDPTLLEYAFGKKIALASPVSLFSVLKTVSFVWQKQALNDNAYEIGELGKEMLSKVAILAKDGDNLASSINKVVKNYNKFAGTLERNIITSANRLAKKVEKAELEPPQILESDENELREWTKPELTYQSEDID